MKCIVWGPGDSAPRSMGAEDDQPRPEPTPVAPATPASQAPDVTRPKTESDDAIAATRERLKRNADVFLERPRLPFAEVRRLVKAGLLPRVEP